MINHIFVKLLIQFISGFVIPIRDTLNYYTSIYHTLNFIFSFIHQSSEKESQFSSSPVFVFLFHPRMSHIFFLIFRKPRALSTDETRPWKRDRTRNKGVPRKNCDFQAERCRLVSPRKRTVLFRNRRSNPLVAGISESDARDNGRGKKRRHRPVVGEKASGKRELYLFHSVSTRASIQRMADFYIVGLFFFLSFLSRGRKDWWKKLVKKFWKWINIEFLIAMRRRKSEIRVYFSINLLYIFVVIVPLISNCLIFHTCTF